MSDISDYERGVRDAARVIGDEVQRYKRLRWTFDVADAARCPALDALIEEERKRVDADREP